MPEFDATSWGLGPDSLRSCGIARRLGGLDWGMGARFKIYGR